MAASQEKRSEQIPETHRSKERDVRVEIATIPSLLLPPHQKRPTESPLLPLNMRLKLEPDLLHVLDERRSHLECLKGRPEILVLLDGAFVVLPFLRLDDDDATSREEREEGGEEAAESCVAVVEVHPLRH
jgi:hypothetical protein